MVINFDASGSTGAGPLNYIWDFGNGNTTQGTDQMTPGAVYVTPGIYTVSLQIEDANGTLGTPRTQTITVHPNPIANFAPDTTRGCPPFLVNFTDQSTGPTAPITQWIWDFGDGNSQTVANARHSYATGAYTVSLIVIDANGCQGNSVRSNLIQVEEGLEIFFQTDDPRESCDPNWTVQFTDSLVSNSPGPFQYAWDFGDGNTSAQLQPSHTFNGFGNYDITLEVTDMGTGCKDTAIESNFINLINNTINFTPSVTGGCGPLEVEFVNNSPIIRADHIATWDFGDGTQISGPATDPDIEQARHIYAAPGSYTVSLSVDMGADLCVRSFTLPDPIVVTESPLVNFVVDDSTACEPPLTTTFQAIAPDAVSWLWDFGNGTTSTEQNPTVTFTNTGNFDVSLRISNAEGCESIIQKDDLIRIARPRARFTHNLNSLTNFPPMWDGRDADPIRGGCLPLDIEFTDRSTSVSPIIDWTWNFGDGNTLSGDAPIAQNPTHTYVDEGIYTVDLTITTADGCMATATCDSCIIAGEKPTALLDTTGYPLLQCCSASTYFVNQTDSGSHDYVWYEVTTGDWHGVEINDSTNGDWDFGSTVPVFQDSGQYVSTIFYAYNMGCADTFFLDDWTMLRPPYGSAGIDTFQCQSNFMPGVPIVFDTSNTLFLLDTTYIDSVLWEFGDPAGTTSNEFYPSITYPDTGSYWITITTWNFDNGCQCRVSGENFLQIKVSPDTHFLLSDTAGCAPLTVQFTGPTQGVSQYEWLIGSQSSTAANPSFTFDSLGLYDVSLRVENDNGCADSVSMRSQIEVSGIEASLRLSRRRACVPFDLTLFDESTISSPIVRRTWDLGNGEIIESLDSVFQYTYEEVPLSPELQRQGLQVILHVEDAAGCTASDTVRLILTSPEPAWTYNVNSICAGDSLFLTAAAGDSIGVGNLRYTWEVPELGNNTYRGQNSEIFFPADSNTLYHIGLTVTDRYGCRATRWDSLQVLRANPEAYFTAFPTEAVCPPLLVNFKDSSTGGNGPVVEWEWDFGDGSQSDLEDPAKIFSRLDVYSIGLTVRDSVGCEDTYFVPDLIRLNGIIGGFIMDREEICVNEAINFTAISPNAATYTWDFGDGEIGLGQTISHTYRQAGNILPTLILKDSSNTCNLSLSDSILVHPVPPIPLPPDTSFCEGGSMTLEAVAPNASILWSTGDTSRQITINQTGTYTLTATYLATGCSSDSSIYLEVRPNPSVVIDGPLQACAGDTLTFQANSPDSIARYRWNIPAYPPGTEDTYNWAPAYSESINLVVYNQYGCASSTTEQVNVIEAPLIDLNHPPVCEGEIIQLQAEPLNFSDPNATYTWLKDNVLLPESGPVLEVVEAGTYTLEFISRGCQSSFTRDYTFHPLPQSDQFERFMNCVYKGIPVSLDAGDYAAYYWEHSGESSRISDAVDVGIYYFTVFNEFGCSTLDSMEIFDACPPQLFVPNAFTPNADGYNDQFGYYGEYYTDFSIAIFNRWGNKVFESTNPDAFWDGSVNGQGVPEGVFVYLIKYRGTHPDYQKMFMKTGTVTLFR